MSNEYEVQAMDNSRHEQRRSGLDRRGTLDRRIWGGIYAGPERRSQTDRRLTGGRQWPIERRSVVEG
jgi:hypothetical protein